MQENHFSNIPNSMNRRKFLPFYVPPGHVAIRMLCHVSRVGGLIGKSGSIVRQIQAQTGSKIRVQDPPDPARPGPAEQNRVIVIIGSTVVSKRIVLHEKGFKDVEKFEEFEVYGEGGGNAEKFEEFEVYGKGGGNVEKFEEFEVYGEGVGNVEKIEGLEGFEVYGKGKGIGNVEKVEELEGFEVFGNIEKVEELEGFEVYGKGSVNVEKVEEFGGLEEYEVSAVQEGVVRVFERVIEVAAESGGVVGEGVEVQGIVSCRLLVEKGMVGTLIGKGGKNIQMLKRESGCWIQVLIKERLPACAMPSDEIVELEGDIKAVKKGLIAVSRCLQDCSQYDSGNMNGGRPFESFKQEASFDPHMGPVHRSSVGQNKSTSYNGFSAGTQSISETRDMNESRTSFRKVIFKLLCPNDRVGGVLGKGGLIVRDLQAETGATIIVGPYFHDCPDRLITISAIEDPGSRYSPAQSAVILVFNRLVAASPVNDLEYSMGAVISARVVVFSSEVGCLLGKGGAIVSEMRKVTGASLRVIGCDQFPQCTPGNVEIVQITGGLENVRNAIYSVTTRLRENLSSLRKPNDTSHNSASSFLHKNSPYGGVRGNPVTEHHPSHDSNRHSSLAHSMEQLRLGQATDHPVSQKSWTPQTAPRGSQRSNDGAGIGSGNRSAVVMNATLEVVVPDNVLDSIYGENGSNLTHLRQLSGAKVTVHESRPGSTDGIIVISGSPEQTQTAQSLLQAFLLQEDPTDS